MKELRDIVKAWREASDSAEMVLVTVIEIKGSTYRQPGAKLFIVDGKAYGSISGGCLESDLISTAWERTKDGPTIAVFDTTSAEDAVFGYGMGCRGIVTVFLRRVTPVDLQLRALEKHLTRRVSTVFIVDVEGMTKGHVWVADDPIDILPSDVNAALVGPEGDRQFAEAVEPLLNLHIYGAGFDALPLARIADEIGWPTFIYDHRSALTDSERFPALCHVSCIQYGDIQPASDLFSAHVVMTHNFEKDKQVLERLLPLQPAYLGVLGPRTRTAQLLKEVGQPDFEGIRSPVGLDIGAQTPQEIALAIAAEIQAVLRSRQAGFLKDSPPKKRVEAVG